MITLTQEERDRFAAYLEQSVKSDSLIVEQMEKIQIPAVVIKHNKTRILAYAITAQYLRGTESVTYSGNQGDLKGGE